jgi:hypothetical protein
VPVHTTVLREGSVSRHTSQPFNVDAASAGGKGGSMKEKAPISLSLEVEEVENRSKPGCSGSSSTNPLCTCPVAGIKG